MIAVSVPTNESEGFAVKQSYDIPEVSDRQHERAALSNAPSAEPSEWPTVFSLCAHAIAKLPACDRTRVVNAIVALYGEVTP